MEKEIIKIRKLDCELKKNIKLNGDFLVPDTKPDVISIIGVNGLCFMKKIEAQNGKLRVDGNYNGTVMYLSDLGETKCLNINFEFSENIENNKIIANDEFNWKHIVLNKEARIINERKINLEISLDLLLSDFKIEDIEMITNFEDLNIQKLQKQIKVKEFLNTNIVNNSISEEFEIPEDGKEIDIIKKEIIIENIEKKISYNKILVKADANMELIYTSENQIKKYSRKIPIMSFIEMQNIKEENIIDLDYNLKLFSINADNNSYNCDLEYEVTCNVFNEKTINVIEDLYSLTKDVEFVKNNISIECITDIIDEQLSFSEKIEIPNLKEIYDYNYCLKKISKVSDDKFEGIVFVELLYSKEDNNGLFQKSFEFKFDIEENTLDIESCDVKSMGGDYYIDYTIRIINKNKYQDISVIKDFEMIETEDKNDYSLIIYYVKPDDTIWTISKEFKVKPESLAMLNRIENPENIIAGEKLYIMRG